MTTLFGIKNCDTVKKARKWLENQGVEYNFHDFRIDGLSRDQVEKWVAELGWENLVNKRSTSWKQLNADLRDSLNPQSVVPVILENPTLIKRPLLDTGDSRRVGFKEADYQQVFA